MPRRCAFGCSSKGTSLHRFPDANKYPERFKKWVSLVDGTLATVSDFEYYKKKMVCDIHFTNRDKNRNNRLNALAIPSLHLHGNIVESLEERASSSAASHNISRSAISQSAEGDIVESLEERASSSAASHNISRSATSQSAEESHPHFEDGPSTAERVMLEHNYSVRRTNKGKTEEVDIPEKVLPVVEEPGNATAFTSSSYSTLGPTVAGKCGEPQSLNDECRLSTLSPTMTGIKTQIIFPATEKHIAKYSYQQSHIVLETPELYEKLTLPHLEKEQFNLQWVYNILEGKCEQDRIIHDNKCEREGFVLLPDLKWDGVTKETLYLLAIVRQRGIKSLRDLDGSHLPLLRRIRDEGKKQILEKYNIPGSQLRIYLHYQPSFYHLHVYFTYLKHEVPGIYAEKSHLLDTVIDNIEMIENYYKKATLPFTITEMENLFNIYETNGHVQRIKQEHIELIDK